MISCFLIDLDGTLFDSSEANVAAYTKAFSEAELKFDENKYRKLFGLRFTEMIQELAPNASPEQRNLVRHLKAEHYKDCLYLVKPNEGLLSLIQAAPPNYSIALVTTASRANVTSLLEHFSIPLTMFDVIIVGEDVQNGKPDPECYLLAMKRLNKNPSDCIIFEDSEIGVQAAIAANVRVIRVVL